MSVSAIRSLFETQFSNQQALYYISTVWENTQFAPMFKDPYQRISLLFAEPDNYELGGKYMESGFVQVDLYFPQGDGAAQLDSRIELIRGYFSRGMSFVQAGLNGVTVTISKTPEISPIRNEGDRYIRTVRIRFHAYITQ